MRTLILISIVVASLLSCQQHKQTDDKVIIESLMQQQEMAWNKGDIEGFMNPYWKSDSLVFIGSRGLNFGWQTVLDNYKKSYPNTSAMGKLTFKNELYRPLNQDYYWVAGKWTLHRTNDTLTGHYTLVWKKIKNNWFIISDHSS